MKFKRKKMISIVVIIFILGILAIFWKLNHDNINNGSTGHFYAKPNSSADITFIKINYNNMHDSINIYPEENEIVYYAYDENGNYVQDEDGNAIIKVFNTDTSEIVNYVFNETVKYLDNYGYSKTDKWSLTVYTISSHCSISGSDSFPQWFDNLLKKLNVEDNGYIFS